MFNKSTLFQWYSATTKLMCSYANVYLFTSDNPSAKDKKLERRCAEIIDSFYIPTNYVILKDALNNVATDLLLGRNDVIINVLMTDYGVLHATLEHHIKDVKKKVKQEQLLVDYYKTDYVADHLFEGAFEDLKTLLSSYELDSAFCKKVYYDSYKDQCRKLKGNDPKTKIWI